MSQYSGYIFILDEFYRSGSIEFTLERDKTFTDAISVSDWHTKETELFLISFDHIAISHAALAHRGNRVATRKRRIRFSNFVEFHPHISLEQIQTRLDAKLESHFTRSASGIGTRIPPKTWEGVLSIIKFLRPDQSGELTRLERLRAESPEHFRKAGSKTLVEERDAVNAALRMADFNPQKLLDWVMPNEDDEDLPPFLEGLKKVKISEDQMIAHDAQMFGDWDRLKPLQAGAVRFRKGNERLTIMNVNRHKIEHTLGVDLFYYHHKYRAYVMIQYKRMQREGDELCYRPIDSSYHKELKRMREFEKIIAEIEEPPESPLAAYRLHQGFCYFKLCPSEIFQPTSPEMIKGMYLPLDYWELLLGSPKIVGPRGGLRITHKNADRYLNNTLFIDLVKNGLIGTRLTVSDKLTDIIQNSLDEDKSVVLAVKQESK